MQVWKYNDKCYLNVSDKNVTEHAVDKSKAGGEIEVVSFIKDMHYI